MSRLGGPDGPLVTFLTDPAGASWSRLGGFLAEHAPMLLTAGVAAVGVAVAGIDSSPDDESSASPRGPVA